MSKPRYQMAVAAHLLLSDADGRVLFMRRANTGYADGQWSLPAGHVDAGETIVAACVREIAEELGVVITAQDLECVLVQHKHDLDGEERIDVFFVGKLPASEQVSITEPDKCDGLSWATLDQLPQPLIPYVREALRAITTSPRAFLNYFGFDTPAGDKARS
jgi:8-oxo-dGTP diphosphatase